MRSAPPDRCAMRAGQTLRHPRQSACPGNPYHSRTWIGAHTFWPANLLTSADSVFQFAAHEENFGLQRLYQLCGIARQLVDSLRIGRVIARPFLGSTPQNFYRTANRRDVPPPRRSWIWLRGPAARTSVWARSAISLRIPEPAR